MGDFYQKVAEDCSLISKEMSKLAARLKEAGLVADAAVCLVMARRLDDLVMATMAETQPIDLPEEK